VFFWCWVLAQSKYKCFFKDLGKTEFGCCLRDEEGNFIQGEAYAILRALKWLEQQHL